MASTIFWPMWISATKVAYTRLVDWQAWTGNWF